MPVYKRWGDAGYKYGNTNRLWGAGAADTQLHWAIEVDWDGDASYNGANEAQYARDLQTDRGRKVFVKLDGSGNATGFQDMIIGTLTVVLDNTTDRYNPYNTSSPLYPYVLPGRYIRVQVTYNSVTYPVYHGKIKGIEPHMDPMTGDKIVTITAEDGQRLLQNTDSSIVVQQSIDIDDAIGKVLDDIAWPSIYGRSLEDSSDVVPYWWTGGKAFTEISDLASAELGTFFIAANGNAKFYSRHHAASATLTLTSAHILRDIALPKPWEVVRNFVKVIAHPLVKQATAVLWTLQDKPLITSGDSLTVTSSYQSGSASVSAVNVLQPVATTDYTANTIADGSGVDKTSGFSVVLTDAGQGATNVITNNSGVDAYLTLLSNRGDALVSSYTSTGITEDAASQLLYGQQLFTLDLPWLQSTQNASDFSAYLLSFLKSPQAFIQTQMEGRPDKQFSVDLFDVVNQTITALSVASTNFKIGGISHKWMTENGQAVHTDFYLEPYLDTSGFWIFNILTGNVTMGVGTIFGL